MLASTSEQFLDLWLNPTGGGVSRRTFWLRGILPAWAITIALLAITYTYAWLTTGQTNMAVAGLGTLLTGLSAYAFAAWATTVLCVKRLRDVGLPRYLWPVIWLPPNPVLVAVLGVFKGPAEGFTRKRTALLSVGVLLGIAMVGPLVYWFAYDIYAWEAGPVATEAETYMSNDEEMAHLFAGFLKTEHSSFVTTLKESDLREAILRSGKITWAREYRSSDRVVMTADVYIDINRRFVRTDQPHGVIHFKVPVSFLIEDGSMRFGIHTDQLRWWDDTELKSTIRVTGGLYGQK